MQKIRLTPEDLEGFNKFNSFIMEDFLTNSTELSPKSLGAYRSNLNIWFWWVKNNLNNKSELDIKPLDFKRFQNWLVNRGCSSSDVSTKRATISSLNRYIEVYYADDYPLFRNFVNASIPRPAANVVHTKQPLTKEEFKHLCDELARMEKWQQLAYLLFTFDTGCRRAESRQLLKEVVNAKPMERTKTITLADGTVQEHKTTMYATHPIRCKGRGTTGKVRKLVFGEEAMQALKKWLEVRGEDDCPYMFVSKIDGKMQQVGETTFNSWCGGLFSNIIGRKFHPHNIRHSRATQAVVEDGLDPRAVQKLLGHENVATTEAAYIIRDESEDLDELF